MSDNDASVPGRSLFLPRLALVVISVLIGLAAIEGGVRFRQWLRYRTDRAWVYQFVNDPRTGLLVPQANLDTGRIRIDSRGFRNPEIQMPKPAGRIRLAFLGGSTTFCMEVSGNEATWPHRVSQELSKRYGGVTFDYINAGVPGFDLAMSLRNLRMRVAALEPDFILYYEASNDFTKDSRVLARREGLFKEQPDNPSAFAHVSTAWLLLEKNLLVQKRVREGRSGRKLQFDADSLARGFERRLEELLRAAHEVAPVCAVATFAHRVRREQPPRVQLEACTSSLYYAPYISVEGFLDGWDAYNRAIRGAARETGTLLITEEDSIPGDNVHFVDSVHFLDPGSKRMADRVVRALVASPEFNRLVATRGGHAFAEAGREEPTPTRSPN